MNDLFMQKQQNYRDNKAKMIEESMRRMSQNTALARCT